MRVRTGASTLLRVTFRQCSVSLFSAKTVLQHCSRQTNKTLTMVLPNDVSQLCSFWNLQKNPRDINAWVFIFVCALCNKRFQNPEPLACMLMAWKMPLGLSLFFFLWPYGSFALIVPSEVQCLLESGVLWSFASCPISLMAANDKHSRWPHVLRIELRAITPTRPVCVQASTWSKKKKQILSSNEGALL